MTKILVIDDERSIRNTLKEVLQYEHYDVELAENGREGLSLCEAGSFDAILCDIRMPDNDGIEVLAALRRQNPLLPILMISGHGNINTAVDCIRKGAYDFIEKPIDLNKLLGTLKDALDKKEVIQNQAKESYMGRKSYNVEEIIGHSPKITHVKEYIDRVAPSEARVLITGANGTGKELVARWLHEKSHRANSPFVEVNCAAMPADLIESELFGHEKGSFTSAIKQHKGKFEQANGGTLFLDEIGDMSLSAQAKMLRALQEHKISRVGSDKDIDVNVRIIAATNKNLQHEIGRGNFREDLYHRLSVIIVEVPALSERLEDIEELSHHFIAKISAEYGIPPKKITPEAIAVLQKTRWPGNIRELRNVIERLLILCNNQEQISGDDVRKYAPELYN